MPELGKATYWLELNTTQYTAATDDAEARTTAAVDQIAGQLSLLDESWGKTGMAAQAAADETEVAATKIDTAAERASAGSRASAAKSESAWGRMASSIKRYSTMLVGGGLAFLGFEGIKRADALQKATNLVNQAIKATGGIAGVSAKYVENLSKKMQDQTNIDRVQIETAAQMLLRFKNVRDVAGAGNDIYTRLLGTITDISAVTGKSVQSLTVQLGKAFQDPMKYLGMLARSGITFTTGQKAIITQLVDTGNVIGAQKYMLTQLEGRYKSAGEAAAKTLGGKLGILKKDVYDLAAANLDKLSPSLDRVIGKMTSWVQQAVIPGSKANMQLKSVISTLTQVLHGVWQIIKIVTDAVKLAAKAVGGWTNFVKLLVAAWFVFKGVQLAKAIWGVVTAIKAATAVTATAEAVTVPFVATLVAAAAAAVGLGMALDWMSSKIPGQPLQKLGKGIADMFNGTPSGIPVSQAQARAEGAALLKKNGGVAGWRKRQQALGLSTGGTNGKAKAPTKKDVSTTPATAAAGIFGPGYTALEDRYAQAKQTKGLADDRNALTSMADYLRKRISLYKVGSAEHLKLENALASVMSKLNVGVANAAKKTQAAADSAFADQMKIELAKASLLGGAAGAAKTAKVQDEIRKHEMSIYQAEEQGLRNRLKDKNLTLKEQAALWSQLASVDKKRLALAKQQQAGLTADDKEIAAFEDLRGTFFGQFASSIFNSTGAGLVPGAAGGNKTINVEQNHTYNEIPKNKFALAKSMRVAAVAAHL